ncbi:unnamed protein product [Dovyalis caffra]|uniref:Uncharacterized protein n=1 Tax=Dovyalis caffra TaxID=77055 RepID=A0AAV1QS41_9ROSI|nr:unnamed protein product [Dovyalis caffra]
MLLTLSFLLLASSMRMFPQAVHAFGNPVLDDKGFPLLPGFPYYMTSSQWPHDSGIVSLGKGNNDTCPLDIILQKFGAEGNRVRITTARGGFLSRISQMCTSVLMPPAQPALTNHWIVKHGKVGFNYTLVAYKLSSSDLLLSIADVGISYNSTSGLRRLALTKPPEPFLFQPAGGLRDVV